MGFPSSGFAPSLTESLRGGVRLLVDEKAPRHGVRVAFAGRPGGVSRPPYDTLNLGYLTGDDRACVDENRARAARAVGFDVNRLVLARQVHGTEVLSVPPRASGVVGEGDGLLARRTGPVLGILTADCAPVIVAAESGVAILHGGWRGLAAGVIERGTEALGGASTAWIGPCIRACCYEVGAEVVRAFENAGLPVAAEDRVDPADAARVALERAGVKDIAISEECTACSAHFYSYRRDGRTGRQGSFVALLE